MAQLSDFSDPAYLDGLEGWTLDDVRARREAATEVETGLSYLRRIVQGRLDIVVSEQRHRQNGERGDVSDLVDQLPSILSDNVHAPGLGRLPAMMAPGKVDEGLEHDLDAILPAGRLGELSDLDDDALTSAAEAMAEFEKSVSLQRRTVLDVVDRLQDEIVRRYRTGEATVDNLLP